MNCLPIFEEKYKNISITPSDEELCIICMERMNNIMLNCLVLCINIA